MSTLRFVLRTDHPDKNGLFPIEGLYQISVKTQVARKYFRIDKKFRLSEENWSAKEQEAIYLDKKQAKKLLPGVNFELLPTAQEVDDINDTLSSIRKDIGKCEKKFEVNNVPYDTKMVVQAYKDMIPVTTKKEDPKPKSNALFEFMEQYIKDHEKTREPGSLTVYKTLKSHLSNFQKAKNIKVTFESIDYNFFTQFQNYLLSLKNKDGKPLLYNTTIAKQLSTIKTFLNYARLNGFEVSDKYKGFKIKKQNKEVIALTNEEFEKLYNMDLSGNRRLEQVRDVFCFSCASGLRFSDLAMLRRENIKDDEIHITVKKTKETLTIPLNPYSAKILQKYKDQYKPLPVISNQKTNAFLQGYDDKRTGTHIFGLCEIAKIDEPIEIVRYQGSKRHVETFPKSQLISMHTGRKTFCTLSLEKGMSAEEVMATSGHKDYQSFKRYVKITEQRKKVVMRNAWGEVKLSKMKAV